METKAPESAPAPPITLGRIALYRLTQSDAEQINRRRTSGASIAERMKADPPQWPAGAQAHIGNSAEPGQQFPMLVVKAGSSWCNGQVFLDGNDTLWVTSCSKGDGEGQWTWPPRV